MKVVRCCMCHTEVKSDAKFVKEGYAHYCPQCDACLYDYETETVERKFYVRVKVSFSRIVVVDAATEEEAIEKVAKMQNSGELVLSTKNGDEDCNDRDVVMVSDKVIE